MKHLAKSWGNFDREQRTSKTTNITQWEILKMQGKPLLHVIQLNPWTLEFLIFVFARWIRILFPLQNMWKVGVNWGEEAVMQTGRSSTVTIGGRSAAWDWETQSTKAVLGALRNLNLPFSHLVQPCWNILQHTFCFFLWVKLIASLFAVEKGLKLLKIKWCFKTYSYLSWCSPSIFHCLFGNL